MVGAEASGENTELLHRVEPCELTAQLVARALQLIVRVWCQHQVTVEIVALRFTVITVIVDVVWRTQRRHMKA